MREMILKAAQQKNPDAATVLGTSSMGGTLDHATVVRALSTSQTLTASTTKWSTSDPSASSSALTSHNITAEPRMLLPGMPLPVGQEKVFYELHIGNVPPAIESEEAFKMFLNEMVHKRGLNLGEGDPIINLRMNPGGHFAFAMFRSREETTLGLGLAGVQCLGWCVNHSAND
jgi:hypothetical protein